MNINYIIKGFNDIKIKNKRSMIFVHQYITTEYTLHLDDGK